MASPDGPMAALREHDCKRGMIKALLVDTVQYRPPLFNDVCHGRSEPLLDIREAIPTWETDLDAARRYAFEVTECI
jgi:hypothetical protein